MADVPSGQEAVPSGPKCEFCGDYHAMNDKLKSVGPPPIHVFRVIIYWSYYDVCLKNPEGLECAQYIVKRLESICESANESFRCEDVDTIFLNAKTFQPRSGSTFREDSGGLNAFRQGIAELKAKVGL